MKGFLALVVAGMSRPGSASPLPGGPAAVACCSEGSGLLLAAEMLEMVLPAASGRKGIEKEQAGRDSPVLLPGEGRVRCAFPFPSGAWRSCGQGSSLVSEVH